MKLGELIEIKHGYAFSGEHIVEDDNGIVLVTPGNFRIGGGFKEEKCKFFDGEIPADYVLKEGDFIVTMTDLSKTIDTLGYSALVPKSKRTYLHNQRIGLVTFKSGECDRGYIYWLMRTREYQRSIANTSTGATVHHTSPKKIYDYDLEVPPLPIQHRIATILSRYDSLIENYQKQIKLLEEAAQRLYKEWFIDLRFPGYENTNIIDGVPEGWEKKSITDVLEIKYGKDHKLLKEGTIPVYGTGGIMRYVEKSLFTGESVLIPRKGSLNNIMLVGGTFWTIDTMFYSIPKENNVAKIVYFYLKGVDMYSFNIGAAVPSMTVNILSGMKLLVPNEDVKNKFETIASKYFIRMHSLQSQLRLLTEARDRLLPKLMSGEIEI